MIFKCRYYICIEINFFYKEIFLWGFLFLLVIDSLQLIRVLDVNKEND